MSLPPAATVVPSSRPFLPWLLLAGMPVMGLACAAPPPSTPGDHSAAGVMAPAAVARERPEITTVVEGLEHPWGMAWLPGGDILITERPGRLRLVRDGRLDPRPVPGVAPVSDAKAEQLFASRQGGLLDVALHPRFPENRWVYFSYAHGTQAANRTRVARARFDGRSLSDWQVLFQADPPKQGGQHFGSRLAWLPDGTLLVSIGDGGNPPLRLDGQLIRLQAQNPASHLGKVVRLRDGAAPEVWSSGHRNIQGLTVDPGNGQVWATEHGSRGGDELNLLRPGANHGWPIVSHSAEYSSGKPVAPRSTAPGFVDPRRVWTPSIAPSGLALYRADRFPGWKGNLFAGGLVSRSVRRLQLDASGAVIAESELPIGERVRDVRVGPDGYLYVLTDEPAGRLLRLSPGAGSGSGSAGRSTAP